MVELTAKRGKPEQLMIECDPLESRRQAAIPLRDVCYFAARVRTAQVVPKTMAIDIVAFGSTVTFSRHDGRVQTYRIVGRMSRPQGPIDFLRIAGGRLLMGKAVGDVVCMDNPELEIVLIS